MTASRTAIVTGGGRGIGRGICIELAQKGIAVAVNYHSHPDEAKQVAHQIQDQGGNASIYRADVADRQQVQSMVQQVLQDFGHVDVLVNNAGIACKSSTEDLGEDEWDRLVDINLKGSFLCSQAVIPFMREQGYGRIINISSIAGQTGGILGPHYAASKAGMIGLTRFMARELGPMGITVNAIAPSGIDTEMLSGLGLAPESQRPVRRAGVPEDVATAVSYLASEQAGYITGQLLGVNGGSFIG